MDVQQQPVDNKSCEMKLADRKSLFQILSFLDEKLPHSSSIHSMVNAAILSVDPTFRIYYNTSGENSTGEQNFTFILAAKLNDFDDSNQKGGRSWMLASWALEEERLPEAIDRALIEIDWDKDNVIIEGRRHDPDIEIIRKYVHRKQESFKDESIQLFDQYYLPMKESLGESSRTPPNVYVQSLERRHAQVIFDYWPYRKQTSIEAIAREIDCFPSVGVFLKANDELIAWMMFYPPNGLSRLHVLEMYRREGYGSLLIRYLSKRCAQAGFLPTVNVDFENTGPAELYKRLGFKHLRLGFYYLLGHQVTE